MEDMMELPMCKGLQKSCKELRMITAEAQLLLRQVAGPRRLGESVKAHLRRLARQLGWEVARTSNIHYGRARLIRAEEWIRLNEEAAALRESAKARQEALHDLDLLARAASAAMREVSGPPRLDGDAAVEQGPGASGPGSTVLKEGR